jgi:cation diffusion facilitator CzcD-associated flavoprotein CzcO
MQIEKMALEHLKKQVPDERLQEALTPRYRLGCKRVLSSNTYYPAFSQANLQLITSELAEVGWVAAFCRNSNGSMLSFRAADQNPIAMFL